MAVTGFGFLPPEVNSGLMYAGAGAGPLLAAATAWDGVASQLHAAAAGYGSVISGLTSEGWTGPASNAMAAAATPYVSWMNATAAQAEQIAAQARGAIAAYETAHIGVVPPPAIAANRAQLATLVATNVLGQNTPAIAANEAMYAEMWAQDATVMEAYANSGSITSTLPQLSPAPQTANPAAELGQGAAAAQSGVGSAATHAQTIANAMAAAPTAPTPPAATTGTGELGSLLGLTNAKDAVGWATVVPQNGSYLFSLANSLNSLGRALAPSAAGAASALGNAAGSGAAGLGGLGSLAGFGSAMTAGLGQSGTVGALSVPQAWAAASPLTSTVAAPLGHATLASAVSTTAGANPAGLLNGAPMLANAASRASDSQSFTLPRFDVRPSVIPISPAAG